MDRVDQTLDEILSERKNNGSRNRRGGGGGGRRRERAEYPRDGVRKSFRDEPRNLDSEWVHDRYEDNGDRRPRASGRRHRDSPDVLTDLRGTKVRVDNVHYELNEEDLEGLFNKIGPVVKLDLRYDRAGRSEGTAYVTYETQVDAQEAVRQFNGANAAGQPISLTIVPSAPGPRGGGRNPFDTAVMPGRPLAERVTLPSGRSRSLSPTRDWRDEAARKGIDRYIPGQSRSRSPMPPRRREGRRPGARREGGGGRGERGGGDRGGEHGGERGGGSGGRGGRGGRPKKTQDELDAEMEDYFGGGNDAPAPAEPANGGPAPTPQDGDVDMIE